jgi:molybdopterin molybdotransferase
VTTPPGPLALDDAIAAALAMAAPLPAASVPLASALGRVLAAPLRATRALPPWPNAGMDGYAVHVDDVRGASASSPVSLPVVATVPAGALPPRPLARGEAMRVMTGAPVPVGADTVIRREDTDDGTTRVTIRDARDAGLHVRPAGEDAAAGAEALAAGTVLGPGALQFAAALGAATVSVHARPRVAVLSTGDELVAVDEAAAAAEARIVDANGVGIAAAAIAAGADAAPPRLVRDDLDALTAALAEAGRTADVIVTSGGVSSGAFDHAKAAVRAAGGEVAFWRMRARPGSQLAVGRLGAAIWLGFPGNPVSAWTCAHVLLQPIVRRLLGEQDAAPAFEAVQLAESVRRDASMTLLLRVVLAPEYADLPTARLAGRQGSHLLHAAARATAILRLEPGPAPAPAGTVVSALRVLRW